MVAVAWTLSRAGLLVLGMTLLIFLAVRVVPGDVVDLLGIDSGLSEAAKAEMRGELGLDRPWPVQLAIWTGNLLEGDLGLSLRYHRPVADMVWRALPTTLALAGWSFAIGLGLGFVVAVAALAWPRSLLPAVVDVLNVWSIAMPTFCIGVIGIVVFVLWLGWLPLLGNMVLPILIIGIDIAGQIAKPLYEDLKETETAAYVRTARAKGVSERLVVWRHILPNAMGSALALSGLILSGLVGGTITMELLFGLPGIGKLALDAVLGRDYATIQAVAVLLAVGVVAINAVVDTAISLVDPRRAR